MDDDNTPLIETCAAGFVAGVTGDFLTHSIDTVKTRMQIANHPYRSPSHAFVKILKTEGIGGLYGGATAAVVSAACTSILYFSAYETSKHAVAAHTNIPEPLIPLLCGGFGEFCASIVFVPCEVVKTRMQVQGSGHGTHRYTSFSHALTTIARADGIRGFYRGFSPTMFREIPFSAIQFAVYEAVKKAFLASRPEHVHTRTQCATEGVDWDGNLSTMEGLTTGAISGAVAGVLTTPFDVVKTRVQLMCDKQRAQQKPQLIKMMVDIAKKEGFRKLWAGASARVMWTTPQVAWMFFVYEKVLGMIAENTLTHEYEQRHRAEAV